MNTHVCNLRDVWPTGHPLPVEDPAKLQGPEVGQEVTYRRTQRHGTFDSDGRINHIEVAELHAVVLERSYVWSPGECRHHGGYRRYDWSVIQVFPGGDEPSYRVVVDDEELS